MGKKRTQDVPKLKDALKLLEGNEADLLLQGEDILYVILF